MLLGWWSPPTKKMRMVEVGTRWDRKEVGCEPQEAPARKHRYFPRQLVEAEGPPSAAARLFSWAPFRSTIRCEA
jgi:hypothetical protein